MTGFVQFIAWYFTALAVIRLLRLAVYEYSSRSRYTREGDALAALSNLALAGGALLALHS